MPAIVTFDVTGPGLFVVPIDPGSGDIELDIREIYSEWKDWAALSDNLKYPPAFRVVGGDPITGVQDLGSTFFLNVGDGWRIRPNERDHQLTLAGNLFTDPPELNPIAPTIGAYTVLVKMFVSNLVDAAVARLDITALLDSIYIDTGRGNDANEGTNTAPVATVARAFELADSNNLRAFTFRGSIVLDRDAIDWTFTGLGSEASAIVDVNGWDVDGSAFVRCEVMGTMLGTIEASSCKLSLLDGLDGVFRDCGFASSMTVATSATVVMSHCFSEVAGTATPDITASANSTINIRAYSGGIEIKGMTAGCVASVDLKPGRLVVGATNTGGVINVRGDSELSDENNGGTTIVDSGLVRADRLYELWQMAGLSVGQSKTMAIPTGDGVGFEGTIAVGDMRFETERQGGGNTVILTRTA